MNEQDSSPMIRPNVRRRFDQLGIGLAGLCALHCVLAIALVSTLGMGSHFLANPAIHRIGLMLAIIVAALGIGWGAIRHRRVAPFVTAFVGLTFMSAALVVPHGSKEFTFTIVGVALVAAGHVLNIRASSR